MSSAGGESVQSRWLTASKHLIGTNRKLMTALQLNGSPLSLSTTCAVRTFGLSESLWVCGSTGELNIMTTLAPSSPAWITPVIGSKQNRRMKS